MSKYSEFVEYAINSAYDLRFRSKEVVEGIIDSENQEVSMMELFNDFRGRYAAAKIANAKADQKDISDAWRNVTNCSRYWFGKNGLNASWPQLRTGSGDCVLKTSKDASEDLKAEKAAQLEADKAAAETAQAAQESDQLAQLRSLSAEELAESFAETILASGIDPRKVMTALGKSFDIALSRPRKASAKKAA